jgi:hypothetical protein
MLSRCLTGALLVVGLSAVPAHGQTPLAWKFKKGDDIRLEVVSTLKQSMKWVDNKVPKEAKQDIEYTQLLAFKVLETKDDGSVVLEQKLESIKFKNQGGSVMPDEKIQGATLKITLGPKRTIDKVEGLNELIAKLAGEDARVRETLKRTLTEESLKKTAQEVFAFLPEKAEKKWTRTVNAPLGPLGNLSIKNEYTDDGTGKVGDKTAAKITFKSTVTYAPPTAEQTKDTTIKIVKGELKADGAKGTILFDAAAGRLLSYEWGLKLKGKLTIGISGSDLPSDVEQEETIKVTLKDAK